MRHIAIVGSGPAGYYTAEAALKQWGEHVRVDIFDALPVPFGLIRSGVAPDHQHIKSVADRYESTALNSNVRFVGNVKLGRDLSVAELQDLYDAVILATGAPADRALDIPGADLGNVFGSAAFVGWYNGHPQFADLHPQLDADTAVVIGNGNVALDVARLLAKSPEEFEGTDIVAHALGTFARSSVRRIVILGRRGPHQIAMTPKELAELAALRRSHPVVDPADLPPVEADASLDVNLRKSLAYLRGFAIGPAPDRDEADAEDVVIEFDFLAAPHAILGSDGRVEAVEVERTRLETGPGGPKAVGTGEIYRIPAGLVVSCIGYQATPIPDIPYDEQGGRFANIDGRIRPGLYCVGWARRGPTGTIGSNRPDGFSVIDKVASDLPDNLGKSGRAGFDALAEERGLKVVKFTDWQKIEEAEVAAARNGSPREKFVAVERMIEAAART